MLNMAPMGRFHVLLIALIVGTNVRQGHAKIVTDPVSGSGSKQDPFLLSVPEGDGFEIRCSSPPHLVKVKWDFYPKASREKQPIGSGSTIGQEQIVYTIRQEVLTPPWEGTYDCEGAFLKGQRLPGRTYWTVKLQPQEQVSKPEEENWIPGLVPPKGGDGTVNNPYVYVVPEGSDLSMPCLGPRSIPAGYACGWVPPGASSGQQEEDPSQQMPPSSQPDMGDPSSGDICTTDLKNIQKERHEGTWICRVQDRELTQVFQKGYHLVLVQADPFTGSGTDEDPFVYDLQPNYPSALSCDPFDRTKAPSFGSLWQIVDEFGFPGVEPSEEKPMKDVLYIESVSQTNHDSWFVCDLQDKALFHRIRVAGLTDEVQVDPVPVGSVI